VEGDGWGNKAWFFCAQFALAFFPNPMKPMKIEPTHNCRHLAWFSIVNLASQLGRYSSFPKTMLNYSKYHACGETRWFLRKTRIPIGLASHIPCLLLLVFLAQGRPGHHDDEGSDCAMAG
jgi:hypothetical protein